MEIKTKFFNINTYKTINVVTSNLAFRDFMYNHEININPLFLICVSIYFYCKHLYFKFFFRDLQENDHIFRL